MKYKRKLKRIFKIIPLTIIISILPSLIIVGIIRSFGTINTDNQMFTDNHNYSTYLSGIEIEDDYSTYPAANFNLDYDVVPKAQPEGTVRIPVLTYHQIAPLPNTRGRDYYVSPTMFDMQMEYLSQKGYKTLTPKEFYDILVSGKNPEQKSVLLTFDDGNYNNYQNAFPILKKYAMTGTFYVPSHRSGIKRTQLQEMVGAGMVIDPHGKTHMLLKDVTDSDSLYQELVVSKNSLGSIKGNEVYSFCYPGCEYNGSVTSTLANNGYLIAFTCGKSIDHKMGRRFSLERMHVYEDMEHFKSILSGIAYYPY